MFRSFSARLVVIYVLGLSRLFAESPDAVSPSPTTAAWALRVQGELFSALERDHTRFRRDAESGKPRADRGYAYNLSALTDLHAITGDERLLTWAREDMLYAVNSARQPDGSAKAFITGFRNLPPFCLAYERLRERGLFNAEEQARIEAQIAASTASHFSYTDFGAQNRGLIDGVGFLSAARVVPGHPEAPRWRRYGEALVYDSRRQWSIEDSSIYQPFWLNYTLLLAELEGDSLAQAAAPTTRYYFDYARSLQMPDGLLPDWGDGDWTHMWSWNVANLVRASALLRDGTYLDSAIRLHSASMAFEKTLRGDQIYTTGLALRWLDRSLAPVHVPLIRSHEVLEDLVGKKIVFRSAAGDYGLLTYRDEGPYARYQRDYQRAQLHAPEEKTHHGHSDENSFALLRHRGTVLLADGGYRRGFEDGWRADLFHNRVVARAGFSLQGDAFSHLLADTVYHSVQTEKIHFGTFGSLDYSRTRLVDEERGYTGDRIVLFAPETGLYLVVDSVLIDRPGPKAFFNIWHPDRIISAGDNYVVSRPEVIWVRKETWPNPADSDLLIQFLDSRDKVVDRRALDRRFHESEAFSQSLHGYFFQGQRLTFVTVLRPHVSGSFSPAMLEDVALLTGPHDDGRTLGLKFTLNGDPVEVGLKLDQNIGLTNLRGRPMFDWKTGSVAYGRLRTDADFAFVRTRSDGSREFAFLYGSRLEHEGVPLFNMPENHEMYQGPGDFRAADIRDKMPRWHEITSPRAITP
jgi:hypothetical protein